LKSDQKTWVLFTRIPTIPLYVQARVYTLQEAFDDAIDDYERLIDLISPYDPKRPMNVGTTPTGDYAPNKRLSEFSLRQHMYYMERVCGRQQFNGLVNLPAIHSEIAQVYFQQGRLELAIPKNNRVLSCLGLPQAAS
ncbi:MAG: hypothetical protein WBC91_23495, partial [Phototrophicaceae bacterium]